MVRLRDRGTLKQGNHLCFCRRTQYVAFSKRRRLRIIRGTDSLSCDSEVVRSVTELHTWSKQKPIGSRLTEWHTHAAGVHDTDTSDLPVKSHVRVTADDQRCLNRLEDRPKPVLRCEPGEDLGVAPRRGVAEEHFAESRDFETKRWWPLGENLGLVGEKGVSHPAYHLMDLLSNGGGRLGAGAYCENFAFAVAVDEMDGHIEVQQRRDRLARHWARYDVSAHYNPRNIGLPDLLEDGFQSRQVTVDIVDRGNAHHVSIL